VGHTLDLEEADVGLSILVVVLDGVRATARLLCLGLVGGG
jgi:hypothetical protein